MTRRTGKLSIAIVLWLAAALVVVACGGQDEAKGEADPAAAKDDKAGDESADGKAPKIVAVEEIFNFGKVKQGVNPEHIFKIRNEGAANLKIEKARGS